MKPLAKPPRQRRRRDRRPRRAHRAGAARFRAGVLRNGRNRRGDPGRRRGSAHVQGASAHPDGRVDRGHRSLSELADAQCHHAGNGKPQRRHPRRPRSAGGGMRCRHARRHHRSHERRHALSRAGAARRQRLSDLAGRPVADVVRSVCGLFSAPDAKPVGRIIAVVGAKGGVGASTIAHNIAFAISATSCSMRS